MPGSLHMVNPPLDVGSAVRSYTHAKLEDLTDNALTKFVEPAVVAWAGKEVDGLSPVRILLAYTN